jgi:hypothetical protein
MWLGRSRLSSLLAGGQSKESMLDSQMSWDSSQLHRGSIVSCWRSWGIQGWRCCIISRYCWEAYNIVSCRLGIVKDGFRCRVSSRESGMGSRLVHLESSLSCMRDRYRLIDRMCSLAIGLSKDGICLIIGSIRSGIRRMMWGHCRFGRPSILIYIVGIPPCWGNSHSGKWYKSSHSHHRTGNHLKLSCMSYSSGSCWPGSNLLCN